MSTYKHPETDQEFSSGTLGCAIVMILFMFLIGGGAVAAIPAFFGAFTLALWLWGGVVAVGVISMIIGYVNIRSTMRVR